MAPPGKKGSGGNGKSRKQGGGPGADAALTSAHSTVSGPAFDTGSRSEAPVLEKMRGTQRLAASIPANSNKLQEYGEASREPAVGVTAKSPSPLATSSTVMESLASPKTGAGAPALGANPNNDSLDRVRVDSSGRGLTTNQGVPVADNQHSLKAGLRGPALLEDFILREKLTHFDHERSPERIVHARG
jgi:catalase